MSCYRSSERPELINVPKDRHFRQHTADTELADGLCEQGGINVKVVRSKS